MTTPVRATGTSGSGIISTWLRMPTDDIELKELKEKEAASSRGDIILHDEYNMTVW